MAGLAWTETEKYQLRKMFSAGKSYSEIAQALQRSAASVDKQIYTLKAEEGLRREPVSESPEREWTDALTLEGDALVISDLEAPFHNSDIVNRAIDLADSWGVHQLILAGDAVHFASLSSWPRKFKPVAHTAAMDAEILDMVNLLPPEKRAAKIEHLQEKRILSSEDDVDTEVFGIRKTFREISGVFEQIVYLPGNHEDRHITAQDYSEGMTALLDLFKVNTDSKKWITTPYYWCMLQTENEFQYRITHPRGAGPANAQRLAEQFHCHVIQGHSHRFSFNLDISGDYFCIQTGHCVDERRLAYVMQRDALRKEHARAFTIVRGGVPYLCGWWSDWARLKKM
jgi:hypothetical protein